MKSLFDLIKTDYKVINRILVTVEPFMDELVISYKIQYPEMFKTDRDIEYLKIGLLSSLIKAVANYTLISDDIEDLEFSNSKGNISIQCFIIRGNERYFFHTYTIVASGPIQIAHYRYLIDTKIRKVSNSTALDKIKALKKKMSKEDRIIADIKRTENYIIDTTKSIEEKSKISKEEIITKSQDKTKHWHFGPQHIDHFGNEENFNNYLLKIHEEEWEKHLHWINVDNYRLKELNKQLIKLNKKLADNV